MSRLLVVLVVLVGCGGRAVDGADCSYVFQGAPEDLKAASTCSGGEILDCCRGTACRNIAELTWTRASTCPRGCYVGDDPYRTNLCAD